MDLSKSRNKNKRTSLPPNGFIKCLYLKNFLTYTDCKIVFERGLNIIFGPNGTGKSSIVCAICLGLCGSPKILGRAKDLQDFIQHGHSEAIIEIELYDTGSVTSIKRIITKSSIGKSQWQMNNNAVPEKNVLEFVGKLGIDMSNLCNFLPQDRVNDFSKMNPQELLIALEENIENQEILDSHKQLSKIFKDKKTTEDSLNKKNQELSSLQQRNELLREEVKRYESWRTNKIQLKLCEQKLLWKKYEDSRVEYTNISKARKEAEGAYLKLSSTLDPKKQEIEDCAKKIQQQKKTLTQSENELTSSTKHSSSIYSSISSKINEINKLKVTLDEIGKIMSQNTQRMNDCQEYSKSLQSEHDKMSKEISQAIEKSSNIDNEIEVEMKKYYLIEEAIRNETSELDDYKETLNRLNGEFKSLDDNRNRLIDIIKSRDYDTYKAMDWANKNRNKFNNDISNPLLLQIVLNNSNDAKYLESHIARRDFFSFIFDCEEEFNIFIQEVRERMGLRINCVMIKDSEMPNKPKPDVSKYGLRCYLEDLITCPKVAYSYLCDVYKINTIPIFNEVSDSLVETITKTDGISCFFTPNEKYTIKISNYSHKPSTQNFKIRASQGLLSKGATQNEIDRLKEAISVTKQKIDQTNSSLLENKNKLESTKNKVDELRSQKKSYGSLKTKLKVLESQIKNKDRDAENLKNLIKESTEDKNKHSEDIKVLMKETYSLSQNLIAKSKENDLVLKKLEKEYIKFFWLVNQHRLLSAELQDAHTLISTHTDHLDSLKIEESEKKTKTKKLLDEAKIASGLADNEMLSKGLIKKFSELPDEISVLTNKIVELGALNAAARDFDQSTIQKHEDINKKIYALTESIEKENNVIKNNQSREEKLKNNWILKINQIIAEISKKFSCFFEQLKCKGYIELNEEENGNYEKYSLNIMVSYRPNEEPAPLSHQQHSGGEKSVATMLFLMAIQQLSKSPFKIVDEINQGMDAHNEKAVFEIMVNTTSQMVSEEKQYFFLSPKVLPDLSYNENLTIHIVFNGPYVGIKRKSECIDL